MTILETTINYKEQKKMSFTTKEIDTLLQLSFKSSLNEAIEKVGKLSSDQIYTIWQYLRFNGMSVADIAKVFERSEGGVRYGIKQFDDLFKAKDPKIMACYYQFTNAIC